MSSNINDRNLQESPQVHQSFRQGPSQSQIDRIRQNFPPVRSLGGPALHIVNNGALNLSTRRQERNMLSLGEHRFQKDSELQNARRKSEEISPRMLKKIENAERKYNRQATSQEKTASKTELLRKQASPRLGRTPQQTTRITPPPPRPKRPAPPPPLSPPPPPIFKDPLKISTPDPSHSSNLGNSPIRSSESTATKNPIDSMKSEKTKRPHSAPISAAKPKHRGSGLYLAEPGQRPLSQKSIDLMDKKLNKINQQTNPIDAINILKEALKFSKSQKDIRLAMMVETKLDDMKSENPILYKRIMNHDSFIQLYSHFKAEIRKKKLSQFALEIIKDCDKASTTEDFIKIHNAIKENIVDLDSRNYIVNINGNEIKDAMINIQNKLAIKLSEKFKEFDSITSNTVDSREKIKKLKDIGNEIKDLAFCGNLVSPLADGQTPEFSKVYSEFNFKRVKEINKYTSDYSSTIAGRSLDEIHKTFTSMVSEQEDEIGILKTPGFMNQFPPEFRGIVQEYLRYYEAHLAVTKTMKGSIDSIFNNKEINFQEREELILKMFSIDNPTFEEYIISLQQLCTKIDATKLILNDKKINLKLLEWAKKNEYEIDMFTKLSQFKEKISAITFIPTKYVGIIRAPLHGILESKLDKNMSKDERISVLEKHKSLFPYIKNLFIKEPLEKIKNLNKLKDMTHNIDEKREIEKEIKQEEDKITNIIGENLSDIKDISETIKETSEKGLHDEFQRNPLLNKLLNKNS